MAAPTNQESAPSSAAPGRRRVGTLRLSPQVCLVLALLVLGFSTYAAMRQSLHPDAYRQTSVLSRDWWGYPLEWNAPGHLPLISRDLRDVYAIPDTNVVYAVGESRAVFVTTDGGQTWESAATRTLTPTPTPAAPTPTPAVNANRASNFNANSNRGFVRNTNTADIADRNALRRRELLNANTRLEQVTLPPSPLEQVTLPPSSLEGETLTAVRFDNEREGSVLTDEGECLQTDDGGHSWESCQAEDVKPTRNYDNSVEPDTFTAEFRRGLGWVISDAPQFSWVKADVAPPDMAGVMALTADAILSGPLAYDSELFFLDERRGWAASVDEALLHTTDGGRTWEPVGGDQPPDPSLHSPVFVSDAHGWAVGSSGEILTTSDGGRTWQEQTKGSSRLTAVSFQPDGLRGWAVGNAGTILYTGDGGKTWVRQTQEQRPRPDGQLEGVAGVYYFRLLPPWYYLNWVVVALLLLPVRRTAVVDLAEEPEPSVADVLVSDRPLEEGDADTIDFKPIALGLSRFLRNENTKPPLTIAITGEWGTGKSSLMNLLRADLRRYDFRPVWFNAWHHQKEEHLLASLLQNVRLRPSRRSGDPRGWSSAAGSCASAARASGGRCCCSSSSPPSQFSTS